MPLPDLHRHLDGSLRRSTLEELAEPLGVVVPDDLVFRPGMGLEGALALFRTTLAVLQEPEAVRRIAAEICEDAAAEGVDVLEIRFAPQLHRGAPMGAIVDAAIEGAAERAGLILCGLYGEDPAILHGFLDLAETRPEVVAVDLAGGPQPGHSFRMEDYAEPFDRARALGVGRTVHAGEGRPPDEIRRGMEILHAQRIGHGTTLLEDPGLVDLLLERNVLIEACPTSNWHTGAVDDVDAHPLPRWLELGIRACINTDNTLFSQVDAPAEHYRAGAIPGMNPQRLQRCIEDGRKGRFTRS